MPKPKIRYCTCFGCTRCSGRYDGWKELKGCGNPQQVDTYCANCNSIPDPTEED